MNLSGFKVSDYLEEQVSFKPVPPGWYRAHITKQVDKPTRADNDNEYLELEWTLLGVYRNENDDVADTYVGRKVWQRLNLLNDNDVTVNIAQKDLAKIMNAIGIQELKQGPQELLGRQCLVRLEFVPETKDWDAKNEVKGYRQDGDATPQFIEEKKSNGSGGTRLWEKSQAQGTVTTTAQKTKAPPF